tara:strand:+ start:160653 stop:160991 length:339 start_codon:yes stop_codon:yes gene_type:complete
MTNEIKTPEIISLLIEFISDKEVKDNSVKNQQYESAAKARDKEKLIASAIMNRYEGKKDDLGYINSSQWDKFVELIKRELNIDVGGYENVEETIQKFRSILRDLNIDQILLK